MSDDIKAGDVVAAIQDCHCGCGDSPIVRGRAYRVTGINLDVVGDVGLRLQNINPGQHPAHSAQLFRKIDAPGTEIAARIRACRPVREQVPA